MPPNHVDYRYDGAETPLFTNLDVAIPEGQKVGLVGRSGSGKTTFVKLIQRIHEINDGSITLGGVDIARVPLEVLRQHIALVPQEPVLFHRSLAENIAYARPGASMQEVREAAERWSLDYVHDQFRQRSAFPGAQCGRRCHPGVPSGHTGHLDLGAPCRA